eukprot:11156997-Lingulodinium_polyedra.AAC.1
MSAPFAVIYNAFSFRFPALFWAGLGRPSPPLGVRRKPWLGSGRGGRWRRAGVVARRVAAGARRSL